MLTSPPYSALSPFWGNSCPGRHRCYLVPHCRSPDLKKSNRSNQKNLRLYNRVVVWFVGRNAGLDQDQDIIKIKILSRTRYVIKTKILPKLICHQNKNVTKIEWSSKLKCHQNWNVTTTEMSPKRQCHRNWNHILTEMLPKLKCYQNWNGTKSKNVLTIKI